MTESFNDSLLRAVLLLFLFTWGLGFVLRVIHNPSRWSDSDPGSWPPYRQIRVAGPVRWLFGYKPVTGPVSMIGAVFQLAAFLTVGVTVALASV